MRKLYPLFLIIVITFFIPARVVAIDMANRFSELFIENQGQVKDENGNVAGNVLFYSQGKFAQLFITTTGYSIVTTESDNKRTTYHKVDFELEHASLQSKQVVFVKGNYPDLNFYHAANLLEDVRTTDRVVVRNVYPGIDWVWSFDYNKNPTHEFMVNLGADAGVIQYSVTGATAKLNAGNNIVYSSENFGIKEGPIILQYREKDFAAEINLDANHISFKIPDHLKGGGFTIDPPLALMWGANRDTLRTSFKSIAADDSLNTFTVGYSSDYAVPTFPQTIGSYSVFPSKNVDLIIMKTDYNQNLVWATFFGGSGNDEANAVTACDAGIFVTGYSESWDFPQASLGTYTYPVQLFGRDAFVAKFSSIGKWKWSTGYGGAKPDEGMDIKFYNGKIFVAGYTKSNDFPVLQKPGAYFYQDSSLTRNDAFLLEFDSLGNREWATCFGGSGDDYFTSLAVDASGIYTTGYSDTVLGNSIPLQNTGGAYFQNTFQQAESFVTRFSTAGALQWSTYFGGGGNDYASCIIKNNCGIFVCGTTDGAGLPVQSQFNGNYYQSNFAGATDGFIAKFDDVSLQNTYCTYYGTGGNDVLTKMATDINCNTIATGYTDANITTVGASDYVFIQDTITGKYDGLMLGLDSNQTMFWATTMGSKGNDFGYSVWFERPCMVDMVGEGFYNYGKLRIGGTYMSDSCTNTQICPQVTSNGVSNRFLQFDPACISICPGGGSAGGGSGCFSNLQFQALIPMKNTCANQCNGEARIDTANIGGCPPYILLWNNGNQGLQDSSLCELYWSTVIDAYGQKRVIYGRFDVFRVAYAEEAATYCSSAVPNWDSLIHMTGGGPPYTIQYRGVYPDSCPNIAYFDLRDTAGCIISYSLPWHRYNINVNINLQVTDDCKLFADVFFPDGSCPAIPAGTPAIIYDGIDTFTIPFEQLTGQVLAGLTFNVTPGRYYWGYLNLPDCPIPLNGIFNLNQFQDTITKVLACQASSGVINVTVYTDSAAIATMGSYTVNISIEGDSTGTNQLGALTMNSFPSETFSFTNLPADNYKIKIYSFNCDTLFDTADLKTVDFRFNSPNTYCEITDTLKANVTGGFAPFNYQWSPAAANSAAIAINDSGTYWLTVTDNIGCVSSRSVYVPGSLRLRITSLTENLDPCGPGFFSTAVVTATGGSLPYAYVWSSGESSSSASYLPQGNNWVRVFDFHGCEDVDSFANTKQPPVSVNSSVANVSCYGLQDGAINLSITDGYPSYLVLWSDGSSGSSVNSLFSGDYDYTVTDSRGCQSSATVTITQPDSIVYFTFTADATCQAYDGYADITVNGGSGPFSIMWFDGDQNFTRYDLQTGAHTFNLTDVNGCSQNGSVDVGEYIPPLDFSIATTDVTCFGFNDGSASITINNGNTPITYYWENGETTANVYDLFAGTDSVIIVDNTGCEYAENVFIDEPDSLTIYDLQISDASCSAPDGFAYIGISGGTQPYLVNWSDGGSGFSRNNLSAGFHSFTITDAHNCQLSGSITISQNNPIIIDLTVNNISCFGNNDGSASAIVINALTPVTYNWSTGSQQTFIGSLSVGTYFLTVTDNRGCVAVEPVQITEPTQLVALVDTGTGIECYGGQTQVYIYGSGGTIPYTGGSYFYGSGTYTEIIIDNNGCSASVTFTLSDPSQIVATVSVTQPTCVSTGSVFVSALGGTSPYDIWYASVNYGTFADTISLVPVTGFNTIQILDSYGCPLNSDALVNTVGLPAGNATTFNPLCPGTSNGSAKIIMTQGANPFSIRGIWFFDSITIQNVIAGNYSDTVTDANGCVVIIDYTLHDPDTLATGYDVLQDFICSDDSVLITFYSNGGTPPYSGTGTFRFAEGNFVHTITDTNGCSSNINFSLVAPTPLVVDTSSSTPDCTNNFGYVHFDVSGGIGPYSLQYGSSPAVSFTDSLTITPISGTNSYTIRDSLGCLKNILFTLNPVNPVLGNIQPRNTNCNNDSSGSITITMTQGAAPYLIDGFSFSDSITFSNLSIGNYSYTITDANNCSVVLSAAIVEPSSLLIDSIVVLSEISCIGMDDAVLQVTAQGGTPAYTYILITQIGDTISQPGNTFTGLGAGTYTVIVIDANGCVAFSMVIIQPYNPSNQRVVQDSVSCYGKNDGSIIIYSEPASRNPFTYRLNDETPQLYNVFPNLMAGDFRIIVSDKFNCTDTLYVSLMQPDSIDGRVWLNTELLPLDTLHLDERMLADFTKQNAHPWEIDFVPDVEQLVQSLAQIKIMPRQDISYRVMVYMDSFDRNCFIEHNGVIEVRSVPPLPNLITPNGDGLNDTWEIDLDKFPHAELTVFDRWGEIIFKSQNFSNDWDGLYHGRKMVDGTYFYLLKVPSHNGKVYKGNINVLNSGK